MNKYDFKKLTPFKWCVIQNFPFIEEDFDAITNYQLLCKVVEFLNKDITNINSIGNYVEELSSYVTNYFDNLDVQKEINNKLDEMAESGQLQEIITAYLNSNGILAFNTVNDLKNATNLIDGSFTKTYGLNTYNDGKGEFYKIRALINTDVIDGVNIIALNNFPTLIAEKMPNFAINQINNTIINNAKKVNDVDMYKGKNLVVFGESWADPDIENSKHGHWVNRVASATGMSAFNFAKRSSSNSYTSK